MAPPPPLNFNSIQELKSKNKEAQQAFHRRIEEETKKSDEQKAARIRSLFYKYANETKEQIKLDEYATKLVYQKKSVQDHIRSKIKKCDQARLHSGTSHVDTYYDDTDMIEVNDMESDHAKERDDEEIEEIEEIEDIDEIVSIADNDSVVILDEPDDEPEVGSIVGDDLQSITNETVIDEEDDAESVVSVDDNVSISHSIHSVDNEEKQSDDEDDHDMSLENVKTGDKIKKALWKDGSFMSLPRCKTQREALAELLIINRKTKDNYFSKGDDMFINQ